MPAAGWKALVGLVGVGECTIHVRRDEQRSQGFHLESDRFDVGRFRDRLISELEPDERLFALTTRNRRAGRQQTQRPVRQHDVSGQHRQPAIDAVVASNGLHRRSMRCDQPDHTFSGAGTRRVVDGPIDIARSFEPVARSDRHRAASLPVDAFELGVEDLRHQMVQSIGASAPIERNDDEVDSTPAWRASRQISALQREVDQGSGKPSEPADSGEEVEVVRWEPLELLTAHVFTDLPISEGTDYVRRTSCHGGSFGSESGEANAERPAFRVIQKSSEIVGADRHTDLLEHTTMAPSPASKARSSAPTSATPGRSRSAPIDVPGESRPISTTVEPGGTSWAIAATTERATSDSSRCNSSRTSTKGWCTGKSAADGGSDHRLKLGRRDRRARNMTSVEVGDRAEQFDEALHQ